MNNRVLFTNLAEDQAQVKLIRRYLYRLGYGEREVNAQPNVAGGSGEQFVREQFARQVAANRSRSSRRAAILIAVIDADTMTHADRRRQMLDALNNSGSPPLSGEEAIAILIPRRNVETWYQCLAGHSVTEIDDFKHKTDCSAMARSAADALYQATRNNAEVPTGFVASLRHAIDELRRIESLL